MRTFHITVNGKTYVVDVDEQGVPASRGQVPAAAPADAFPSTEGRDVWRFL